MTTIYSHGRRTPTRWVLVALLLLFQRILDQEECSYCQVEAWSSKHHQHPHPHPHPHLHLHPHPHPHPHPHQHQHQHQHQHLQQPAATTPNVYPSRRQVIAKSIAMGTTVALSLSITTTTPTVSHAACLPGDLSKECIGVYKVPIDDRILPYVSTPEALKRFAPDLNYVPPQTVPGSIGLAWEILETQRLAMNDIQQVVQQGRLEEAGIKVLNLVPKVTQSGKVIVEDCLQQIVQSSLTTSVIKEMTMNRLETQWGMVLGLWGETDIMIGQALKGDMGVSAVAQIYLLKQIKDATAATDDFMALASSYK